MIWTKIVQNYSYRRLSYASDRLPALDGIASEFNRILGQDHYLFGLWRNDLVHGLLWRENRFLSTSDPTPDRLNLPSWSWACSCNPIYWYGVAVSTNLFEKRLSKIVEAGDADPSRICLEGNLMRFNTENKSIGLRRDIPQSYGCLSFTEDGGFKISFELDQWYLNTMISADAAPHTGPGSIFFLPLVYAKAEWLNNDKSTVIGLLLQPHPPSGNGVFHRVGTGEMVSDQATLNRDNFHIDAWYYQKEIGEEHYLKGNAVGYFTIAII
jgi:hypothetical protein